MSLSKNIENAFLKSMGYNDIEDKELKQTMKENAENLSSDISNAIIEFLQAQEFNITKMKAIVKLDQLTTTGNLNADIKSTVQSTIPPTTVGIPTPPAGGALPNPAPIPLSILKSTAKGGVTIPRLKLKSVAGQGGSMNAVGYAYVGRNNPVSPNESNEDETIVKLVDVVDR